MTATNHALTGALIGLTLVNPVLAIPAAVASHFVCDALPHYAMGRQSISTTYFRRFLTVDALLCVLLVLCLAVLQPSNWLLAAVCAFLATSPDLMWLPAFVRAQNGEVNQPPTSGVLKFHSVIQWFERPIGGLGEVAWAIAALILLKVFIV